MPVHLENEAAVVAAARGGDAEAFTLLVRQYDRNIYRLALNILRQPEDAEEVLQETFLKAYSRLGQFQGHSRFYTWLVRIAVNEALQSLRRRRHARVVSLEEPVEQDDGQSLVREIEDWGEGPEQRFSRSELQELISAALARLAPVYRMAVLLRDVEELSTEETAAALGISVSAVKSRVLRGRLFLRESLNRYFRQREVPRPNGRIASGNSSPARGRGPAPNGRGRIAGLPAHKHYYSSEMH